MARRQDRQGFSPRRAAVSGWAGTLRARPTQRRRRPFQFERLEDRLLMSASGGPEFVHNPYEAPPGAVIGEAKIIATNDFYYYYNNEPAHSLDVLSNDTAPNGAGSFRIKEVTATSLGATLTIAGDGKSIVYMPAPEQTGKDSFRYIVEDAEGNLGEANVSVQLSSPPIVDPNPPKGPTYDRYDFLEDERDLRLHVLWNDYEFAGGTIVEVSAPSNGGTVGIADDGKSLIYSPAIGFRGYENFNYTVSDADGNTATAVVGIEIQARYVIYGDRYSVDVNAPQVRLNVLENDWQRENALPPQIVSVEQPAYGGSVAISNDGQSLLFKPADGFIGYASFQYTVRYGPGEHHLAAGSVTLRVVDPYLAVDNWFLVDPESTDNELSVLANDVILAAEDNLLGQHRTLRITGVSAGSAGGQLAIDAEGQTIHYAPAAGFTGDETFTYTVVDNTGHEDSATVTVDVGVPAADPFNLPRFRTAAELEQFLLDEAVARYACLFGTESRQYVPNDPPEDPYGGGRYWDGDSMVVAFSANDAGAADYSTTNVQHAGIDEADVVETDGQYIYALSGGRLVIVDVHDVSNPRLLSVTHFTHEFTEMYLQGDRITLLSRGNYADNAMVLVLDVGDRAEPTIAERTEIDGRIVDSRAIGDRVHIVTQRDVVYPAPQSHVVAEIPSEDGEGVWKVSVVETFDEYAARLVGHLAEKSLPMYGTYNVDGVLINSGLLSDESQIHKPVFWADRTLVSVVTFDVGDDVAGPITSTGLFSNPAQKIYVSHSAVYTLRASRYHDQHTEIFRFDFQSDGTTSLEAVGEVRGVTLNQFSLDEFEGRLRIVTTESIYGEVWDPSIGWWRTRLLRTENHLFVLGQNGTRLQVVGSLEHVAPTEEVKSVRFVGDRAYVVTFRVVDPLFAIDLGDPTDPRIAGAIKIPGFSNYLHPVGEDYVIGFGRNANEITGELGAAQVSLFYVGDLDNPQLVDRMTLEGADWSWSEAYGDHHAVAYFDEHQVFSVPISWQAKVPAGDFNGDGVTDNWVPETRSAAFLFQFAFDGASGSMEFAGRIEHETDVRRSVRIGDALITISDQHLKVHDIRHPDEQIAEVYLGSLPRDDMFNVLEDSGTTELGVRANDRLGVGGRAPTIVEVTQPVVQRYFGGYFNWGTYNSEQIGTVAIADDGKSVDFTPNANFFGTATFTYTVFDELRGLQTATVTVQVENVPDDPDAANDEYEVASGSQAVQLDVLNNDTNVNWARSDPYFYDVGYAAVDVLSTSPQVATLRMTTATNGDFVSGLATDALSVIDFHFVSHTFNGLKITAVGPTDQGGTIEIDEFGQLLNYTPAESFEGIETFTYTIETSEGRTDTATVAVRVGAVSEAAWAAVLEGLNRRSTSEAVELSTLNAPATIDLRFSAIDTNHRSFAETTGSARSFRRALAEPQFVAQAAADLLNLSLAASDAGRVVQTSTDDAFEELLIEPGGKDGLCDELTESLVAELTTCLIELR